MFLWVPLPIIGQKDLVSESSFKNGTFGTVNRTCGVREIREVASLTVVADRTGTPIWTSSHLVLTRAMPTMCASSTIHSKMSECETLVTVSYSNVVLERA